VRFAISAPACSGSRAKAKAALAAMTAARMKAGPKSSAAIAVYRKLLADGDQRRCTTHVPWFEVRIRNGVQAGELQRAEYAAEQQRRDDQAQRRGGRE
jgi:hypothetical protein